MLNKTRRAPPRYKISDFFSSLLDERKGPDALVQQQIKLGNELMKRSKDLVDNEIESMASQGGHSVVKVISLIVAALAVFFGPLMTLRISRKQFELSRRIADRQIVAPTRQGWIERLREKIAELTSSALHYWNKDWSSIPDATKDEEQKLRTRLEHVITLLINS